MENMKKEFYLIATLLLSVLLINAQEINYDIKKDDEFIHNAFHAPVLINSQTSEVLHKKSMEFLFEHRFGKINSDFSELYGFNAPANYKIGIDYGFTDKFTLNTGFTKFHSLFDMGYKLVLLKQTTSGRIPFSLSYYGNTAFSLGNYSISYRPQDRVSFFKQIIASHKFDRSLSVFIAPGFMHFNSVDTSICIVRNSFLIAAGGKINILQNVSIIFEYGQGHLLNKINREHKAKPGVSFGTEIASKTYSFQVFSTTFRDISEQDNFMYNSNDFLKGEFLIGFNITRKINFLKKG
jgi:hypothetical protein